MGRHRTSRRFNVIGFACLFLGIVEATGALLWCFRGAGIYGSPLAIFSPKELAFIASIILVGPVVALLAGLLTFWKPRWAAYMLFAGAALSAILSARYQEVGLLLAAIISLPMCLAGLLVVHVRRAEATETTSSPPSDVAGPREQRFQFSLQQLMLVVTALGAVLGLALAHSVAARERPYVRTPLVERLLSNEYVPAGVPLEAGAGLLGRLGYRGGRGTDQICEHFDFKLNYRYEPPHRQWPPDELIKRLRKEVEDQLNADGVRILETTDSAGTPDRPANGAAGFRIKYRWQRTQGAFKACSTTPNSVEVRIEESTVPSFLSVGW